MDEIEIGPLRLDEADAALEHALKLQPDASDTRRHRAELHRLRASQTAQPSDQDRRG